MDALRRKAIATVSYVPITEGKPSVMEALVSEALGPAIVRAAMASAIPIARTPARATCDPSAPSTITAPPSSSIWPAGPVPVITLEGRPAATLARANGPPGRPAAPKALLKLAEKEAAPLPRAAAGVRALSPPRLPSLPPAALGVAATKGAVPPSATVGVAAKAPSGLGAA